MAEDTKPTEPTTEPTPSTEPNKPPVEKKPQEPDKPFKSFNTQEDYDNEMAKTRGVAERKVKAELFKQLGIDSEDKLEAIKQAYQNSLTDKEKQEEALKELGTLKSELEESKAIITALAKTSNRPAEEITKLVKMAKGLVGDGVTIDQALDEVLALIKNQQPQQQKPPASQVITKSSGNGNGGEKNPFKEGNMTEMGKLIKEDINKARELAKLANYPVNF